MYNISKNIKHILNENQKFNVIDYNEEDTDIISGHEISVLADPKTLREEEELFMHTEASEESLTKAQIFLRHIESIVERLNDIEIPDACLRTNEGCYELYGGFSLFSKNEDTYIDSAFEYAHISIEYNTVEKKFTFHSEPRKLADLIEYSDSYKSSMVFSFVGAEEYFKEFQKYLKPKDAECIEIFIWPKGFYNRPEYKDTEVEDLLIKIYDICIQFIDFTDQYIEKFSRY